MRIITVPTGQLQENCYLLYLLDRPDAVLIDPGDEPDKIKQALNGRKVAAVLLTHGHFDHTGALAAFPGVPIYMHEADQHMLSQKRFVAGDIQMDMEPRPAPTDFVADGDTLQIAGLTFEVLHTPGHTQGSVCYQCGTHLFTGDTLFDGDYGRTDLPGGSMEDMRRSLARLLKLHGLHAYPGHDRSFVIA